ncbi:hypothetical protein [Oribacterium sp. NK2B42]|uniref:hypothetical protein n=1 Tax=Oribacterium sp. NK2B42 TaxID=689781 RepID=UPI000425F678|nr:hypothetical protein [Oribacterium sp. NK2B42]
MAALEYLTTETYITAATKREKKKKQKKRKGKESKTTALRCGDYDKRERRP